MNVNDLNKKINYNKTNLDDRKKIVNEILETGYYTEYFDERFKVNLNSTDNLSEHDYTCNSLERLANYLLNSDEIKDEKKSDDFEYKFYSDEEAFNKAINKEPKIDGMGDGGYQQDNIIHFLKKENRNYKKSKDQVINKSDLARDDELGQVLRSYTDYLEKVTIELNTHKESKLSRFKLTEISGSIKQDMINSKNILLGVFGFKTNAEESCEVNWDLVDFKNPHHVKALLYMKPGRRADEDLMYLIDEFLEILFLASPTKLQREIIDLMRDNKGPTEIGNELGISKQRVVKNINMLVKRICRLVEQG